MKLMAKIGSREIEVEGEEEFVVAQFAAFGEEIKRVLRVLGMGCPVCRSVDIAVRNIVPLFPAKLARTFSRDEFRVCVDRWHRLQL